jgi:hypothetical protein
MPRTGLAQAVKSIRETTGINLRIKTFLLGGRAAFSIKV